MGFLGVFGALRIGYPGYLGPGLLSNHTHHANGLKTALQGPVLAGTQSF